MVLFYVYSSRMYKREDVKLKEHNSRISFIIWLRINLLAALAILSEPLIVYIDWVASVN